MEKSRTDNQEKLATLGIQETDRRRRKTTQKLTKVEQQRRIKTGSEIHCFD